MKVLITGFDPFGGADINPAYEAVKLLPDQIKDAEIIKMEIPTVFEKEGEILEKGILENKPDIVICVGQAGGRSAVTIEKVAINRLRQGFLITRADSHWIARFTMMVRMHILQNFL